MIVNTLATAPRATVATTLLLLVSLHAAAAQQNGVVITGGNDDNPQIFVYEVTNNTAQPITMIEFPHFRGDLMTTPPGWVQEWKNKIGTGAPEEPGYCRIIAEDGAPGLRPGRTAEFEMRVARGGALARPGNVAVQFADGSETWVRGVIVPSEQTAAERYYALFGLAAIFIIVIIVQLRRMQKRRAAGRATVGDADDGEYELVCGACGHSNPEDASRCANCGQSFQEEPTTP